MTVQQITKALQCCLDSDTDGLHDCCKCSIECGIFESEESCTKTLLNSVINLIERQEAEIAQLHGRDEEFLLKNYSFDKYYDHHITKAKAEAIKEFAERVKMSFYYEFDELIPSIMADKIDELAKEMMGGENNA